MDRHLARLDTAPDAPTNPPVCGICDAPVILIGGHVLHDGETRRPRILPAPADRPVYARAELLAERALDELPWTPHTTDADRAAAVVEALYAEGLISARPRAVRARRVPVALTAR